ncbi:MAG: hypothetical protein QG654_375 [Patescibacteria group bacterium]|nr:hypothetical protein [Patescibacteria group bacterium]
MKIKYILFFVVFFVPILARAEVLISEVAWMGTVESQFEEWVEIRNTGAESVSLEGWKIYKAGGETVLFSLSGDISPGEYFLVCRTTASVVDPLSGSCNLKGSFGGSGLNNSSEHILLKNSGGDSVDEIDATGGWPAGSSSTKQTMQKSGSSWITADPTPGEVNASSGVPDEGDENEDEEVDEEEYEDVVPVSSSSSISKKIGPIYSKKIVEIQTVDSSVPVGSPVNFSLKTRDLKGANILRGEFFWNMGDGTERYFSKNEKFEHTYDHEGTYIVYLKYYGTFFEGIEPEVVDKVTITVNNSSVAISEIHEDGSIEIKNSSSQEIDLSDWSLKDGLGKTFVVPDGTYIPGNKTLVLNSKRTKLNPLNVTLFSPNGAFASYKEKFSSNNASASKFVSTSNYSEARASSPVKSSGEVLGDVDEKPINLNEKLSEKVSSDVKQKQSSFWMIVFVCMIALSSVLVFFIYKKKEEKVTEEDDFELID